MSGILKSTLQLVAEWRALLPPSGGGVLSPTAVTLLGVTGLYGGQKLKDDSAASDANILNSAPSPRSTRGPARRRLTSWATRQSRSVPT